MSFSSTRDLTATGTGAAAPPPRSRCGPAETDTIVVVANPFRNVANRCFSRPWGASAGESGLGWYGIVFARSRGVPSRLSQIPSSNKMQTRRC